MQTRDTVEGLHNFAYLFPFKHFLQNRKNRRRKKFKSNTTDNEVSLTTFSIILNIIKSNNVTFNVFIISISKTSASQTSVAIWSFGLRKHLKGNAS